MVGRLASTVFQNNAKSAMVVEDAYNISTGETRNSVFDSVKGIYSDSVKGLYANKGSIRELASIITQAKAGTLTKADMLERALGAMGSSLPSLLGQLGGSLFNGISGAAASILGEGASQTISVLYKNAEILIKAANITDAQDSAEFLAALTGNDDLMRIVNVQAESAVFGGILNSLMQFGIPELIDDAVDQAQSETVKRNALAYLSTSAVNGSDLAIINKVIDRIGIIAFLEQNPDAINRTLASFFFGSKDTIETWPAKRLELLTLLNRIDSHWSDYLRNGTYIKNLEPFSVMSADAKTLMMMADPERTLTMAAAQYQVRNVADVIHELYPNAYLR